MAIQFDLCGVCTSTPVTVNGEQHQPQCMAGIMRTIAERYPLIGVAHNSGNHDLQTLYEVARLAVRHAIFVGQRTKLRFVEIGTWCGESAVVTAAAVIDTIQQFIDRGEMVYELENETVPLFELHMVVVDHFTGTLTDCNTATCRNYGGSILEVCRDNLSQLEFQRQARNLKITVEIVQGESVQVGKSDSVGQVDFAFIDAGHTYEEVLGDFDAWAPHVIPGCWLAGHDYQENFPGVIRAVDEKCSQLYGCAPLVPIDSSVWLCKTPFRA